MSCYVEDVQYIEDITVMSSIDDDGWPNGEIDRTDGDFKYYQCTSCDTVFGEGTYDPIKAWKEVKEHLDA